MALFFHSLLKTDFVLQNYIKGTNIGQGWKLTKQINGVIYYTMEVNIGDIVLPGDIVNIPQTENKSKVILGPGLRVYLDQVLISTCGILKKKEPNTYWVESHRKRYVPARGETVVGIVLNKTGDIFKVDIGSSEQASLSYMAFEGATKKNRPDIQVGDIVFARLLTASRDMEPELVCVDSYGKKGKLGQLQGNGFLFSCSLNLVRKILNSTCPLLKTLGREIAFDIAIGMNGKIWVNAKSVRATIAIGNAILAAEHLTEDEIVTLCNDVLNALAGM